MESNQHSVEISISHVWKRKKIIENKKVKDITILSDVTVDFCGGCVQMIIGPSGSGKTSLLRLLNKLDTPDKGKITYNQNDYKNIPPRKLRKDIGMVFQVPALFRGSVIDNIFFGPRLNNETIKEDFGKKYLNIVGLGDIDNDRDVENLSIGQQQRVSFARALANNPKILLLDEPTSSLDPSAANNLLDLIKKINKKFGVSIIMVTHVMEHARRIADTVCLLADGRLVECGEADSFFDQPKTELARKFIRGVL